RAQLGGGVAGEPARSQERVGLREVPVANLFDGANGADQVAFRRLLGEGQERVRDAGERRDDDDRAAVDPRGDDSRRTPDRVGVGDRRTAELEDDHDAPSRPQCSISSALSTDAPAAPRMTLCPIATNFTSNTGSGRTRPTTTVIPCPVSTWRRGCGRSGRSLTTIGRSGELGNPRADSSPRQSRIACSTAGAPAFVSSSTERQIVWPCSTATRLVCALTANVPE